MARWDLTVGDQSHTFLAATLDERHVAAWGDQYAPSLLLPLGWEEFLPGGARQDAWSRVMAVSFALHIPHIPLQHWVRTGLMPVSRAHVPILPLSLPLIEELTRLAQARPDGEVVLDIGVQVLAEAQDSSGAVRIHWHQNTQPVIINAPKWHAMLKQWGYPTVRLVPLYTELPQSIGDGNEIARATWAMACARLQLAHENWTAGHSTDAGEELRHVVQLAIRTWGTVWHPDNPPGEHDGWAEVARRIGEGIPGCDLRTWTIRTEAPADAQRAFSFLTLLRNLNTIANPFHHVGHSLVYTRADTDMLLTATTAILRSLPEFWRQFPNPLLVSPSKPTAAT